MLGLFQPKQLPLLRHAQSNWEKNKRLANSLTIGDGVIDATAISPPVC